MASVPTSDRPRAAVRRGWRRAPRPWSSTAPSPEECGSTSPIPGPGSPPPVAESITRASAMPSATAWWTRMSTAAPEPKPSIRYTSHSGRPWSSGAVDRSPTSSRSASRSCGAGTAIRWKCGLRVEVRNVLPVRARQRAAGAGELPEAGKAVDDVLDVVRAHEPPVRGLVEPHQRVDDHQVRRAVHPQPGGIRVGHGMVALHGHTATGTGTSTRAARSTSRLA